MSNSIVEADQLRLFIERIERLEEEKKGLGEDISAVYSEAKMTGYDVKTMRKIVALRKMETHTRNEADALLETYRAALGLDVPYSMRVTPATDKTPLEEAIGDVSLVDEIAAKLEEAGLEREPGTNTFKVPAGA